MHSLNLQTGRMIIHWPYASTVSTTLQQRQGMCAGIMDDIIETKEAPGMQECWGKHPFLDILFHAQR